MKSRRLQKSQFPNSLVNWEQFASTTYAHIKKAPISHLFSLNWEQLRSPVPKSLCELEKDFKVQPKTITQKSQF